MKNLCVIDASRFPGPIDEEFSFPGYSSYEDGKWRSWRSITAAQGTDFFAYGSPKFSSCFKYDCFLILLNSDINNIVPFLEKLKKMRKTIILAYHECAHIIDNEPLEMVLLLRDLVNKYANYFWNVNSPFEGFWTSLFDVKVLTIPTMAPFDLWKPKAKSFDEKSGILIATRTLNKSRIKRDTIKALMVAKSAAKELDTYISYINEDGPQAEALIRNFMDGSDFRVLDYKRDYNGWISVLNDHKIAFQLDNSNSLGQVVTDGAFVNTLALGGHCDNAIYASVDELNLNKAKQIICEYYLNEDRCLEKLAKIKELNFQRLNQLIEDV